VFGSAGDLILGTGRASAGGALKKNKSYGKIRKDTLCRVRDLNS